MAEEPTQSQLDKFKKAARELETDDDPKRFGQRLGKLVRLKAVGASGPSKDEGSD